MKTLLGVLLFVSAAWAKGPCDLEQDLDITGHTPKECAAAAKKYGAGKYEHCYEQSGESWLGNLAFVESMCAQGAMERELDKRLLVLKTKDAAQFKKEMALQKDYNKGMKKFCEEWSGGTAGRYNEPGCHTTYYTYRFALAEKINGSALEFSDKPAKKKPNPLLAPFAKQLCELPKEVWKDKAPPKDCVTRVLADMQRQGLFATPGND